LKHPVKKTNDEVVAAGTREVHQQSFHEDFAEGGNKFNVGSSMLNELVVRNFLNVGVNASLRLGLMNVRTERR
jgi:hypothetical protein